VGLKINDKDIPCKVYHRYYYDTEDVDNGEEYHTGGSKEKLIRKSKEEVKILKDSEREAQLIRKNQYENRVCQGAVRHLQFRTIPYTRQTGKHVDNGIGGSVLDPNEYLPEPEYQNYRKFKEIYNEDRLRLPVWYSDDDWDD